MFSGLKLRWKLMLMILPLALLPMVVATAIIGSVSIRQIYREVDQANRADLEHMNTFTLDLIDAYYRLQQLHQDQLLQRRREGLGDLAALAYRLVDSHYLQVADGIVETGPAQESAYRSLKDIEVGEVGYFYVMRSGGELLLHIDREGQNIIDLKDEGGNYFAREMSERALGSVPGEILYTSYSWPDAARGGRPRRKEAAFVYFEPWDWIIAAGSYLDSPSLGDPEEAPEFEELRQRLGTKAVGRTGAITVLDCDGAPIILPENRSFQAGAAYGRQGRELLDRICRRHQQSGWLRYRPQSAVQGTDQTPVLARFGWFEPWQWIAVVELAEEELTRPAREIARRLLGAMVVMLIAVGALAGLLALVAAKRFTEPIRQMTAAMRRVKSGHLEERLVVSDSDELGEMAAAFNQMTEMLERDLALEDKLARQQKMASLGVFSAKVAHEINNPMGIVLGYACHLETKIKPSDPRYYFVQEIRRESQRCVGILGDLLGYARSPELRFQPTDLGHFLDQVLEFAAGHKDLKQVRLFKTVAEPVPEVMVDRDQIRQVIMNLVLNGAAAMPDGGELKVSLGIAGGGMVEVCFADSGGGIDPAHRERIFEPFFSTRKHGTGLGLAISKQIVEAHLGTIEVNSVPGAGTVVTVLLPIKQQ